MHLKPLRLYAGTAIIGACFHGLALVCLTSVFLQAVASWSFSLIMPLVYLLTFLDPFERGESGLYYPSNFSSAGILFSSALYGTVYACIFYLFHHRQKR